MTPTIQAGRPGPQDTLRSMSGVTYREAYKRGMSLSAYLEDLHPQAEYNDGLDAFSRLLRVADIRVNSIPELGVMASRFEAFDQNENTRALVHEWMARQWRRVAMGGKRGTRGVVISNSDDSVGGGAHPWIDAGARAATQIAPAIPLAELVALTTPIDGDAYRAYYLNDAAADRRMVRVGEAAEIPKVSLTGSDQTIRLYKYGRVLEASYEILRRMPIDKVGYYIQRLAVQAETDKVATVIDVLVNGDGNAGTGATSFNLTALDSGTTANNLTLKAWLAFKLKFPNPYMLTTALVQEAVALSLMLLNTGSANIPLVAITNMSNFGSFRQINPGLADQVGLGWTSDAPANKILGVDTRMAVERVIEIGANVQEVEKFVTRQTQALAMTETEGYSIMDKNAAKLIDLTA